MKKTCSRSRFARPLWCALPLFVLLAGAAGAEESREPDETIIRGHFIDRKVQTNITFSFHYSNESVHVRHEDGPEADFGSYVRVSFRQLCRDPVSGLDYLFLTWRAGGRAPPAGQYWYVDPASGSLELAYSREQDDDMEIDSAPYRWVSYAGACGWREQQEAQKTRKTAFDKLGVPDAATLEGDYDVGDSFTLPVQELDADVVRDQLAALDALPVGERVVFSLGLPVGEADKQAWRVLQVTDPRRCPGRSIVLALDRAASTWRSVYDRSGGQYDCDAVRMEDMYIQDGKLFARVCAECATTYAGGYSPAWVQVDIKTNRGVVIEEPGFAASQAGYDSGTGPERRLAECRRLNDLFDELNGTRDAIGDPWIRGQDCDDIRFPPMPLSG